MIVGSKEWCDYWAAFHQKQANKWAARLDKYGVDELTMTWMFLANLNMHWWQDMEPWN